MINLNDSKNCLIDVLKLINNLQKCVTNNDFSDNGCSRPFLGIGNNISFYNTRPVTFFLCNGSQLELTYFINGVPTTSNLFRIEDINDSCVTVRLLNISTDGTITSTSETAIINTNCICALKCLNDISLDL